MLSWRGAAGAGVGRLLIVLLLNDGRIVRRASPETALASLMETCKWHDVNPEAWLADMLTRLVGGWPNRRLAELTPWAWKAAQATVDRAAA
jgi:hypothetical protein